MSRSYTPGLKILSRTKISKQRKLPLKGVVHLSVGDVVKPDEVVASTDLPGNIQMVNVDFEVLERPHDTPTIERKTSGV